MSKYQPKLPTIPEELDAANPFRMIVSPAIDTEFLEGTKIAITNLDEFFSNLILSREAGEIIDRMNLILFTHADINGDFAIKEGFHSNPSLLLTAIKKVQDLPIYLDGFACYVGIGIAKPDQDTELEHKNALTYKKYLPDECAVILNSGKHLQVTELAQLLALQAIEQKHNELTIPEIFLSKMISSPNTTKLVYNTHGNVLQYASSALKPTSSEDLTLDKIANHITKECNEFIAWWNEKNPLQPFEINKFEDFDNLISWWKTIMPPEALERLKITAEDPNHIQFLTNYGNIGLFIEVSKGKLEYMRCYLDSGLFDVNFSINNLSLIHSASTLENPDAIEILLEHENLNISAQDRKGSTALHMAASKGLIKNTDALLLKGANPDILDRNRGTALHYVAFRGYIEITKALLKAGASANPKGSKIAPHELARQNGYMELAELLLEKSTEIKRVFTAFPSDDDGVPYGNPHSTTQRRTTKDTTLPLIKPTAIRAERK